MIHWIQKGDVQLLLSQIKCETGGRDKEINLSKFDSTFIAKKMGFPRSTFDYTNASHIKVAVRDQISSEPYSFLWIKRKIVLKRIDWLIDCFTIICIFLCQHNFGVFFYRLSIVFPLWFQIHCKFCKCSIKLTALDYSYSTNCIQIAIKNCC